jgi:hypothetical protein
MLYGFQNTCMRVPFIKGNRRGVRAEGGSCTTRRNPRTNGRADAGRIDHWILVPNTSTFAPEIPRDGCFDHIETAADSLWADIW